MKKKQHGFTLVEMLVVIAIIGILVAVVLPNVGRFIGRATATGNTLEHRNMQAAVDSWMAVQTKGVMIVQPSTRNFAVVPAPPLYPDYIRTNPTKCAYSWDAGGVVTQTPDSCP